MQFSHGELLYLTATLREGEFLIFRPFGILNTLKISKKEFQNNKRPPEELKDDSAIVLLAQILLMFYPIKFYIFPQ